MKYLTAGSRIGESHSRGGGAGRIERGEGLYLRGHRRGVTAVGVTVQCRVILAGVADISNKRHQQHVEAPDLTQTE